LVKSLFGARETERNENIIKMDFKTIYENVDYISVAQDMKETPALAHTAIDLSVSQRTDCIFKFYVS